MDDAGGAYYVVDPQKVEDYRVKDAEEVVRQLWRMYFAQEPRSIVFFEEVVKGLVELHESMAVIKNATMERLTTN